MTATWFLLIFLYTGTPSDATYIDKVSIPMTGKLEQACTKDTTDIWRYNGKLEGIDRHQSLTVCVPLKQWRPS